MAKKKISIVTCCFNEEGNIRATYEAVKKVFENLKDYEYEHIFEDNASTDNTQNILREIARNDKAVKVIINGQNYGPERSGRHAWTYATGDALIEIAADLQNPPEMIPVLLSKWEEGYKIVLGQKSKSRENSFIFWLRKLYYKMIASLSDTEQLENVTGFGIYDRDAIDSVVGLGDTDYYLRGLLTQMGYKWCLVPYTQNARKWGKSSYNLSRYFDFALLGLTHTSHKPLRLVTILGLLMSIMSFIIALIYLVYKIIFWDSFQLGLSPMLIGVFFLGGIQLLCLGIIGEYVGQILTKVTKPTRFVEAERINIDDELDNGGSK